MNRCVSDGQSSLNSRSMMRLSNIEDLRVGDVRIARIVQMSLKTIRLAGAARHLKWPAVLVVSGLCMIGLPVGAWATDYNVGPNRAYPSIGAVPWYKLRPGDNVFIEYKP